VEEVRQEPLAMPAGFEWSTIDVSSEEQLTDVYDLLTNNYVEDNDASFRFDYSTDFLTWALTPPGFSSDLHIGVRASKSGKLVGFISGVPSQMRVNGEPVEMVEINFLCVHKKLRDKRLAPVLIREVTRRVNLTGVWQAVYTAGVRLPRPVSACRYFHRSLNPKKLVDIGFSHLSRSMTMTRLIRLNKLPSAPLCERLRPMEPVDVPAVTALLNEYLSKFKLSQVFTEDEIAHYLLPRPGVIQTMVVPGEEAGEVTDFFSFYFLNSHVMKHDKHNMLYAVYSYYTVATSMSREELIRNALIVARDQEADVFNCLNLQDNQEFIENLRFGRGDGNLHYYLFNWQCPTMSPEDIGLILL
jgi:glycylpeptide N-tetradecanoyltransferase